MKSCKVEVKQRFEMRGNLGTKEREETNDKCHMSVTVIFREIADVLKNKIAHSLVKVPLFR